MNSPSFNSDRIGGIISLCLEDVDVERPNLGMEICDKKQEDHALYATTNVLHYQF